MRVCLQKLTPLYFLPKQQSVVATGLHELSETLSAEEFSEGEAKCRGVGHLGIWNRPNASSGGAGARRAEGIGKRSLPAVPWNEKVGTGS